MKNPFVRPLLILPFDHRSSFAKGVLGYESPLTPAQKKRVVELKEIVYAAFQQSLKAYSHLDWFGILLDEEYGSRMLKDAKKIGVQTCLTTEKSGQKEYQFEYGSAFGSHIDAFKPEYVKVLVRWNPANTALNRRQLKRLKRLSEFCRKKGYKLLFELLIPPTARDIEKAGGVKKFETYLRPMMTASAIRKIQKGVWVDVWKLEGMTKSGWRRVLSAMKPGAHAIVLGRGEDKAHVKQWLKDAAYADRVIGFAVGRTIFAEPLERFAQKKISKKACVNRIAKNFSEFVNVWSKEKGIRP